MIEPRRRRDRQGKTYTSYRVRAAGVDRTLPRGTTRKQAEQWETKVKQLAAIGELDQIDAGGELLADFVLEWWNRYATVHLAHGTLAAYKVIWEKHFNPRVGGHRLREIDAQVLDQLVADLVADQVGKPTIRKGLGMLQGVMHRAVEWRRVRTNPFVSLTKPKVIRQHVARCFTPVEIERLRGCFTGDDAERDATIVAILAYSGPRPQELLRQGLDWTGVQKRSLLYPQPKTSRPPRPVRLIAPLAADLKAWRKTQSIIGPGPVIPNTAGGLWTDRDWRSWRRYRFQPAMVAAGLATIETTEHDDESKTTHYNGPVPYDLRHTWASLLIQEQKLSLPEIAAQMGHSVQTLLENYTHVIADLAGEPLDIEAAIRDARAGVDDQEEAESG